MAVATPDQFMKAIQYLAAGMMLLNSVAAASAADSVRVLGKLTTRNDDPPKSPEKVVKKQLTLTLSGAADKDLGELLVKTTFYADDLVADKIAVEKEIQSKATLERGRADVVLEEVAFQFTPAHTNVTGSGKRSKAKRVEASGHRYHGWAAEVFKDSQKIGEAYSHPSLKPKQ